MSGGPKPAHTEGSKYERVWEGPESEPIWLALFGFLFLATAPGVLIRFSFHLALEQMGCGSSNPGKGVPAALNTNQEEIRL